MYRCTEKYACIFSFDDRSKLQRFLLKSAVAYRPKTDDLPYSSMRTSITTNHKALKSCQLFRYLCVHYTLRRCTKVSINNKRTTSSDLPEREGRRCWWDFDKIDCTFFQAQRRMIQTIFETGTTRIAANRSATRKSYRIFTAMPWMQGSLFRRKLSVCPSVHPSVKRVHVLSFPQRGLKNAMCSKFEQ